MARGGRANGPTLRLACVALRSANGHYRVILPMQEMARRGHTVHWPGDRTFRALEAGGLPAWDVMHIQQMHDEEGLEIMERLRRAGIAIVWDSDDDISAVTRGSEAWHLHGGRRGLRRHIKRVTQAVRTAHLVTTTNEHLAGVYREVGGERVVVIENYIAPEDLQHPRKRHQGVVIGVTLAGEHEPDVRKLKFAQMLERLLERHDGVRVVALGIDLRLRREHRYTYIREVKIDELIPAESEFDIGLAPLVDSAFNRARSNVKLKEYAAAGAMWVASPVGPYLGLGEEQGGLLVGDDEWLPALEALLRDGDHRRALQSQARAWVRGQTIRAGAARWQAVYRDAVERARNGG